MRVILSILVTFSILTGSVGINLLNSTCEFCEGERFCKCSGSCLIEEVQEAATTPSCCSHEDSESVNHESACSHSEECCTTEFYKFDFPLFLVYDTHKIQVPEIELPKELSRLFCETVLERNYGVLKRIPYRPPPISSSDLDSFCAFLC